MHMLQREEQRTMRYGPERDLCSTPTNSGQLVGDQPKWAVANIQKKHVLCLRPQETDCSVQSH